MVFLKNIVHVYKVADEKKKSSKKVPHFHFVKFISLNLIDEFCQNNSIYNLVKGEANVNKYLGYW